MAYITFRCHQAAACTCRNTGTPRGCTARHPLGCWSMCLGTSSGSCHCSRWSRGTSSTHTLVGTPPCPALALARCRFLQGEMDISMTQYYYGSMDRRSSLWTMVVSFMIWKTIGPAYKDIQLPVDSMAIAMATTRSSAPWLVLIAGRCSIKPIEPRGGVV